MKSVILRRCLVYFYYYLGNAFTVPVWRWGWGCLYKYYNKYLSKSADLDTECRIWKREKPNSSQTCKLSSDTDSS